MLLEQAPIPNKPAVFGPLEVELIDSPEALRSILLDWRQMLSGGATGANLFNDPDHIALRLESEPQWSLRIVILRRDGQIRCIAPFFLSVSKYRLQLSVLTLATLPVQFLKVFGDDFIIAACEEASTCIAKMFEVMRQHPFPFSMIQFDRLIITSALGKCCQSTPRVIEPLQFRRASSTIEQAHQIKFPPTYEEYLASLNSRTRQHLRSYARKLQSSHKACVERITRPEQVPRFLNQVDQVFRESWQGRTFGYYRRDTAQQVDFYRKLAERGWLRSYVLSNDDGPIAFEIVLQYDNIAYCCERGFNQDWTATSPGRALTFLLIEDFYRDRPPHAFDFGMGDAAYKRNFSNVSVEAVSAFLVPPGRWRWIMALHSALNAVERGARRSLEALKLDRAIRKLLKRQR